MPRGLAQKLILSLTVIVVLIAAVFGVISLKAQERQLLSAMILGADQLSKAITSSTWHAMLTDNKQAAYEVMKTIAYKQGIERIRMFNREGRIRFSTRTDDMQLPLRRTETAPRVHIDRTPEGHRTLTMVTPIYNEPSCSQAACHAHPVKHQVLGVLDLTLELSGVDRQLTEIRNGVFLATAVQILLIGGSIVLLTRRFLVKPIQKLIAATRSVSNMDLDQSVDTGEGSEEIRELSASFDVMRVRLKAAMNDLNQAAADLERKVDERTQQLRAAHQKLLQSDRLASLGQLAASVAHEINNPIGSILTFGKLLQRIVREDGIPRERIGEFQRYLGTMVDQTARVGRIVSDLLAFSRRSKPQRNAVDLNKIVEGTSALIAHKLRLANVEIQLDMGPLPPVHCDSSQIQQVVLNLLLNAAEAIQPKGAGQIRIGSRSDNGTVQVSVSDNGEGIREEHMARIFEPFFTTKADGKGVGLGLAVSYGIVQSHGGDLTVSSRPGEGTTFTITLPVTAVEHQPEANIITASTA
jgi:two-component system NtrC family sensor kinase